MNKHQHDERMRLYLRLFLRIIFSVAFILILKYIVLPLFSLLAPFAAAFIVAYFLNPAVTFLHKKLRAPRSVWVIVVVILVLAVLSALIVWFVYTLFSETVSLAQNIQIFGDFFTSSFNLVTEKIKWVLDFLPGDTETVFSDFTDSAFGALQSGIKQFTDYIITHSIPITTGVGTAIIASIIFIMATFFITSDYPKIKNITDRFKGTGVYNHLEVIVNAAKSAFGGYIRAQLILMLMAFVFMFTAFAIYGQDYAFLIALALAILDFLPILGAPAALVPWGIMSAMQGAIGKSIFIFIITASFFLIRRFAEPKIVGSQTGLPPVLALLGIYIGMKLAGVLGMILGPIIFMIIISIIKAGVFDNTVKDIKSVIAEIGNIFKKDSSQ